MIRAPSFAAVILALRKVLLQESAPPGFLLLKLAGVSIGSLIVGTLVFRSLRRRFYDYL